jgi:hypothetical protein
MQSRYPKQVAYNDRIIQAEKEVAAINADIPYFLCEMTLDPTGQVVIVLNGSERMKKEEEEFAGQLWMQSDRHMTAATPPYQGTPNSREAAILTAMADAITWKHALADSIPGPRKDQRVVIYPREISVPGQVLSSGNPNIDGQEDLSVAYASILQASRSFELPPLFLREDSEQIISDPVWSVEVPKWMATAASVATGSRGRVLQNGPDVMRSDDEDALKDEHGEELTNMYAPGCSSLDQARLTEEQAQAQRAFAPDSPPDSRVPPRS